MREYSFSSRIITTISWFVAINAVAIAFAQTTGFDEIADLRAKIEQVKAGTDTSWVITMGALVFFMQTGFAALEVGSVSKASTKNILLKNAIDCCIGAILWWAVGFPFAFGVGETKNGFIGNKYFFAMGIPDKSVSWSLWFFQYGFASTSATIVSGSIAERIRVFGYIVYCCFVFTIIYPIAAHWMWSTSGWISPYNTENTFLNLGAIDYAGDCAVHMVGGFSGLAAAYFIGYRGQFSKSDKFVARFEKTADGKWIVNDYPSSNDGFATIGTLLLWFCWYGFNAGSTLDVVGFSVASGRIAVNTTISAGAAGLTSIFYGKITDPKGRWSLNDLLNGILAGLVSITGPCATVTTYGAFVIGILGGIIYKLFSKMLLKLRIDDPLDAFPVHGGCGAWGVLAGGFLSTKEFTQEIYQRSADVDDWGVFYGGNGKQLACQIVSVLAIAAWSLFCSTAVFGTMRLVDNKRRDNPVFTIREKFEVLSFGGNTDAIALDFLPPRKDLEIEMESEDSSSGESSDSEKIKSKGEKSKKQTDTPSTAPKDIAATSTTDQSLSKTDPKFSLDVKGTPDEVESQKSSQRNKSQKSKNKDNSSSSGSSSSDSEV